MAAADELPDWEKLLAAERHVQQLVPGAVLVGGTAAALHAGHRRSSDGDHVLTDLRDRFDSVLSALEAASGWQTNRTQRPVLILGQLDGMLTGIRQLRRTEPLETEMVAGLTVPTLAEMARIKAWLLATRNTVRDYLDLVVLLERLGESDAVRALASLDALYRQEGGASLLSEVAERLGAAAPGDRSKVDLATYQGLVAPWNDWTHLAARGRFWATLLSRLALEEEPVTAHALETSRALWNRNKLDLRSDEILAQILDRGEMAAWRELYALAPEDAELRRRIVAVVRRVPLPLPHFWLAAMKGLGEDVDIGEKVPEYPGDVA